LICYRIIEFLDFVVFSLKIQMKLC